MGRLCRSGNGVCVHELGDESVRPSRSPKMPPPATPPAPGTLPGFDYVSGGGAQFPRLPGYARAGSGPGDPPVQVQGLTILKPPYGRITAYDMNQGTIAWQIANGDYSGGREEQSAACRD